MPKRILFVSPPLAGHTNQLIVLAQELAARGHHAGFTNSEMFRERITRAGVEFLLWDPEAIGTDKALLERFHAVWARASAERSVIRGERIMWDVGVDLYVPFYRTLAPIFEKFRPDLVVADSAGIAGMDLAAENRVPSIMVAQFLGGHVPIPSQYPRYGTPFTHPMTLRQRVRNFLHPLFAIYHLGPIVARLNRYRRQCVRRETARVFSEKRLTLVCTCFGVEHPRPLPPLVQMVGPMIPKAVESLTPPLRQWLESSGSEPVVFVSFGTLAKVNERQAAALVHGLAKNGFRILWSLPKEQHHVLPSLPENFRLESFVPQQAVLAHPAVRAFVSHCGMNSVSESLYWGKPILGLPIFGDQHYNAARLVDLGVGLKLDKESVTEMDVRRAVRRLIDESGYKTRAERMSVVLQKARGLDRAADAVEVVLGAGIEHLLPVDQRR